MNGFVKQSVAVVATSILAFAGMTAAVAAGPTVQGAGSTWSQIAVDQWRADVKTKLGLNVNFTGNGSSAGRALYVAGKVDFAVTEIPFSKEGEPGVVAGQSEVKALNDASKTYQYFPIVAGGTALMYNLLDATGKRITNLQLSPSTLAKIFTGKIKNWNDPAITADNGGRALPSRAVVPVYRSDGSGTSAQFTAYLALQQGSIWSPFAKANGIPSSAGTSNFPNVPGFVGQSGSDGVANYVANKSTGVGAIGYLETGYAVQRGFPVAAIRNKSGKYTLPTPENVSIALQAARLNSDNTQILTGVYNNADPTAYPISSYSYMVTPKGSGLPADKGQILSKFVKYFACDGQQKASVLGYAPLPPTLVQVVFSAIQNIPGHIDVPAKPTASNCNNPTFQGKIGSNANSAGTSTGGSSGGTGGSSGGTGGTGTGASGSGTTTIDGSGTTDGTGLTGDGGTVGNGEAGLQAVNLNVSPQGSSVALPAIIVLLVAIGPAVGLLMYRRFANGQGIRKWKFKNGNNG